MKIILWFLFLGNIFAYAQQSFNDLTVKDLKVVNTAKGSKPCPLMTTTQRDAIASPLNGQCIYNTTTSKLNTYNGSAWKQVSDVVVLTTDVSGVLPIANGGTASSTRPFVDLSSSETIGGTKTFSSTISGSIDGNAATATNASTVTTNANLTGHVTSTGNAAVLGSFSSSNLLTALTDETGSGVSVFATSPTLVTPVLGAASATSLTLSSPLTVANGGTGLATLTLNNVVLGNGTSTPAFVAPGSNGNVLTSNGTTWTSAAPTGGTAQVSSPGATSPKAYSVFFNSSGVASGSTGTWIPGSCSYSAGIWSCPVDTGIFTVTPNCVANADGVGPRIVNYYKGGSSTTLIQFLSQVTTSGSNTNDVGFSVFCHAE